MGEQAKIVIPESGLTKDQLKEMVNNNLSLHYFICREGDILDPDEIPSHWPDFLFEKLKVKKDPETIEEWIEFQGYSRGTFLEKILKKCHKWTIENERKKT